MYGDDAAVRLEAEAVACPRGCPKATQVSYERSPVAETSAYAGGGGEIVAWSCMRAAVLAGRTRARASEATARHPRARTRRADAMGIEGRGIPVRSIASARSPGARGKSVGHACPRIPGSRPPGLPVQGESPRHTCPRISIAVRPVSRCEGNRGACVPSDSHPLARRRGTLCLERLRAAKADGVAAPVGAAPKREGAEPAACAPRTTHSAPSSASCGIERRRRRERCAPVGRPLGDAGRRRARRFFELGLGGEPRVALGAEYRGGHVPRARRLMGWVARASALRAVQSGSSAMGSSAVMPSHSLVREAFAQVPRAAPDFVRAGRHGVAVDAESVQRDLVGRVVRVASFTEADPRPRRQSFLRGAQ